MLYALFFATMFSLSLAYGVALMLILSPSKVSTVPPMAGFVPMRDVDSAHPFRMNARPLPGHGEWGMLDGWFPIEPTPVTLRPLCPSIGQTRLRGDKGRMIGSLKVFNCNLQGVAWSHALPTHN